MVSFFRFVPHSWELSEHMGSLTSWSFLSLKGRPQAFWIRISFWRRWFPPVLHTQDNCIWLNFSSARSKGSKKLGAFHCIIFQAEKHEANRFSNVDFHPKVSLVLVMWTIRKGTGRVIPFASLDYEMLLITAGFSRRRQYTVAKSAHSIAAAWRKGIRPD